ncbi:MAG: tetratricopeptide repeat protein [Gemmatimonadota bacterium]
MAYISEIEKLERRWADNPLGLTFAPLAEAYRKGGEPVRALELLQSGLEVHPDYIPANIVLGRCHLDLGDDAAAESAFARVVALDHENVIALKALADITERQDRLDESARWLEALLLVDRSNEEAREQLNRVNARRPAPAPHAAAVAEASSGPVEAEPPVAESAPEPEPEPELGIAAAAPEATPEPDLLVEEAMAAPESRLEPDLVSSAFEPPADVAIGPMAGLQPFDPQEISVEEAVTIELAGTASEFQMPSASEALANETVLEAAGIEPERVAEGSAFAVDESSMADESVVGDEAGVAEHRFVAGEPAVADGPVSAFEEDLPAPVSEPEPIVTESMADLYVSQGHLAEALAIYRQLADRDPNDIRLQARVAHLAAELEARAAAAAPPVSYAAAVTGGTSVAEFFRALVAHRPEGVAAAPPPPAAVPEADPAASAPLAAAPDLSFDEFYRADPPPTAPGSDNIDDFQAWLQSLKR